MSNIDYKNIYLYDHNFVPKGIIDTYTSMIWTERYNDIGDCELVIPMNAPITEQIKLGDYVELIEKSDEYNTGRNVMMINYINAVNNKDTHHVIFKGQDQTRLLKQRIIPLDTSLSIGDTYMDKIKDLVKNNMMRQLEYLRDEFGYCSGYSKYTYPGCDIKMNLKTQVPSYWENYPYKGSGKPFNTKCEAKDFLISSGTLFDAVKRLCDACNWGFKINLDDDNNQTLYIYCGKCHDGTEPNETTMIFSMEFDNLISSELEIDARVFANHHYVIGSRYDAPDYDTINDNKKWTFKRNQKVSRYGQLYESLKDDNTDAPSIKSDNWRKIPWHPFGAVYSLSYPGVVPNSVSELPPNDVYDEVIKMDVKDYYEDKDKQQDPNSDNREYISNIDLFRKMEMDYIKNNKQWNWKQSYKPEIYVSDKYTYKKDYALGDLVTYIDKFAGTFIGRIMEFTRTLDDQGYREFPTINVEE